MINVAMLLHIMSRHVATSKHLDVGTLQRHDVLGSDDQRRDVARNL